MPIDRATIEARRDALSARQAELRKLIEEINAKSIPWQAELNAVDADLSRCQAWLALEATFAEGKSGEVFEKSIPADAVEAATADKK